MVTNYFLSVLSKRTQHTIEKTTMNIAFIYRLNLTKKAGTKPINKAAVVTPKASPGLNLSTLKHMAKVMLIVMEKMQIPMTEIAILFPPKMRKGTEMRVEATPTVFAPNRSVSHPPKAFPRPITKKSKKDCQVSVFQDMGMA